MRKCYIAPDAQLLKFQAEETLAEDPLIQESTGYDNVVDFDDLLKPKGW